ncbi:hypothetical protein T12_13364, partial [Trichinella patagoniensis]
LVVGQAVQLAVSMINTLYNSPPATASSSIWLLVFNAAWCPPKRRMRWHPFCSGKSASQNTDSCKTTFRVNYFSFVNYLSSNTTFDYFVNLDLAAISLPHPKGKKF